ncbi:MAG: peptidoglycan-associated lipoprotein [Myxococcales bacterium]|nr:peptidoglycan-associated lipoprotein [Myxococcales bacterium]
MSWKYAMLAAVLVGGVAQAATKTSPNRTSEVFFDFDSSQIRDRDAAKISDLAKWSARHPNKKLVLAAHADPIGTSDYNVGLSTRRGEAVRDALILAGVARDRIVIATFGEDGPKRATKAQDRRVTISTTSAPLYVIIDRTLNPATAVVWTEPASVADIEGPRQPIATR